MGDALKDLSQGFMKWRLWGMLAIEEIKGKYHRTFLGPIWIIGSFLIFIVFKIYVFSSLADVDGSYFAAYLVMGHAVWMMMTSVINQGAAAFVSARSWILGVKTPFSLFLYENLAGQMVHFVLTFATALVIAYLLYPFKPIAILYSFGGICLTVFSMFWVMLLLATLSVFVRDIVQVTQAAMRISFFISPVLWVPSALGEKAHLLNYVPFTHYIAIIRAPLLNEATTPLNWIVVAGLTVVLMIASITLFSLCRKRIPSHV